MPIMNHDFSNLRALSVIEKFVQSKHNFYLTGSRFFGVSSSDSDYDFFTGDTPGLDYFLEELGFECVVSDYNDNNCKYVCRHHEAHIDVQVVKDPCMKEAIQESMKRWGVIPRSSSKSYNTSLWNFASDLYNF